MKSTTNFTAAVTGGINMNWCAFKKTLVLYGCIFVLGALMWFAPLVTLIVLVGGFLALIFFLTYKSFEQVCEIEERD